MAALSGNQQPKEKRRNSEKRKEKSRDAARCRRSKESEIFADLALSLPLPSSVSSQLDKASIMRLTIAYLKARTLLAELDADDAGPYLLEDTTCMDALVPRMLDGFLVILSSIGDIVYITENVNHLLGVSQIDLIGQSIYDYSHPCDHSELREALEHRTDGVDVRSFFARFKCTLSAKGRNVNLKSASHKVIRCNGRLMKAKGFLSSDEGLVSDEPNDYLVLVGEPIPHPANIEGPTDHQTFLTKHSMDFKYTYVDEKISNFLGYLPEELEGKSALEFHHTSDTDVVLKNYKTLLAKGQSQTSSYRFLARCGGYVWLETQSTVVYGSRDSRPQAIVCVHHVLSGIEEADQVLSLAQAAALEEGIQDKKPVYRAQPDPSMDVEGALPLLSTSKIFAPRTEDMSKGFLTFDDKDGITVIKEEPEDLTHLAPMAGDVCIPLEMPASFIPLTDLLEDVSFPAEVLDCFPLTTFDFPAAVDPEPGSSAVPQAAEEEGSDSESAVSVTSTLFNSKDPFVFTQNDPFAPKEPRAGSSSSMSDKDIFSPLSMKSTDTYEDYMRGIESPTESPVASNTLEINYAPRFNRQHSLSSEAMSGLSTLSLNSDNSDTDDYSLYKSICLPSIGQLENCPALSRKSFDATELGTVEDDDFEMRAPFIPMGDTDDLPLFGCEDFLIDARLNDFSLGDSNKITGEATSIIDSNLAQLLQTPSVQVTDRVWQSKDPIALKESPQLLLNPCTDPKLDLRGSKRKNEPLGQTGDPKRCKWSGPSKEPSLAAPEPRCQRILKSTMNGGGILVDQSSLAPNKDPINGRNVLNPSWRHQEQLPTFKAKSLVDKQHRASSVLTLLANQQKQKQQQSKSVLLNLLDMKNLSLKQQLRSRLPGHAKEMSSTIYPLASLTSYDCEVNAPLQSITGLLQGDDLLDALDLPLEFETSS